MPGSVAAIIQGREPIIDTSANDVGTGTGTGTT